jgi:hypothetical protein
MVVVVVGAAVVVTVSVVVVGRVVGEVVGGVVLGDVVSARGLEHPTTRTRARPESTTRTS